jgi:hypothetical protein
MEYTAAATVVVQSPAAYAANNPVSAIAGRQQQQAKVQLSFNRHFMLDPG